MHKIIAWCGLTVIVMLAVLLSISLPAEATRDSPYPMTRGNLQNEILYYITVDRFADGDLENNIPDFAFPISADVDPRQRLFNQANRSLIQHTYDPNHRYVGMHWGGDLAGVIQKLDYLKDLGVTQLVLSPIQDNANAILYSPGGSNVIRLTANPDDDEIDPFYRGVFTSFHGTWTRDWFEIEEHFRDPDSETEDRFRILRQLLDEAGARGIGVILELSLNSTSPYRDSLSYGEFDLSQSEQWLVDNGSVYRHGELVTPYLDPLTVERDPRGWFHPPMEINYRRLTPEMLEKGSIGGLPDLAQENTEVKEYLLDAIRFWLSFNSEGQRIRGFYLDSIPNIPLQFWREVEETVLSMAPDMILIGDYSDAGYANTKAVGWYDQVETYSWINYGYSMAARNFFRQVRNWNGRSYVLREHALGRKGQYYTYSPLEQILHRILNPSESLEIPRRSLDLISDSEALSWVNMVESHHQPRLLSQAPEMSEQAYASLIAFVFVSPGVPMLMYGVETGLSVPYHIDHQGLFGIGGSPFNQPMMIGPNDPGWDHDLFALTRRMAHLRQEVPALRYGSTRFLNPAGSHRDSDLFMLREVPNCERSTNECAQVLYAYSTSGGQFTIPLDHPDSQQAIPIEQESPLVPHNGSVSIHLKPEASEVLLIR